MKTTANSEKLTIEEFTFLKSKLKSESLKKVASVLVPITPLTEEHLIEVDKSKDFAEYEANHG